MRILILAHFAGSPQHGMVYGHYYLAREWVRLGHEVAIVASGFAHTRHRQPELTGPVTEEWIDGIRYLWVRTPEYVPADRLGRVRSMLGFVAQVGLRRLPVECADLVICSSHYPFAIHPARRFARRCGARLVFEVRDLWPLTLIELGWARRETPSSGPCSGPRTMPTGLPIGWSPSWPTLPATWPPMAWIRLSSCLSPMASI